MKTHRAQPVGSWESIKRAKESGQLMRHIALTENGRKRFIGTFERRMSQEITHPLFGYRVSYRRLLELQARLLARHLLAEINEFPHFTTR